MLLCALAKFCRKLFWTHKGVLPREELLVWEVESICNALAAFRNSRVHKQCDGLERIECISKCLVIGLVIALSGLGSLAPTLVFCASVLINNGKCRVCVKAVCKLLVLQQHLLSSIDNFLVRLADRQVATTRIGCTIQAATSHAVKDVSEKC